MQLRLDAPTYVYCSVITPNIWRLSQPYMPMFAAERGCVLHLGIRPVAANQIFIVFTMTKSQGEVRLWRLV
jgi:hypothetical protein